MSRKKVLPEQEGAKVYDLSEVLHRKVFEEHPLAWIELRIAVLPDGSPSRGLYVAVAENVNPCVNASFLAQQMRLAADNLEKNGDFSGDTEA